MANRRAKRPTAAGTIVRGSGNVFADLGFVDADERQTKLRLAYAVNRAIESQRLTPERAATQLGLNRPKVSALRKYKLEGFSVERLMTLLDALAQCGEDQRGGGVRDGRQD
jgi:predicted XRE-type DNA-binding protein